MNNGDSFHNGSDNLELQRKNRLGITDEHNGTEAEDSPAQADTPADVPTSETTKPHTDPYTQKPAEPHQRPYQNIYAQSGGISRSAVTSDTPADSAPYVEPADRNYTNIYAKRVAERTQPMESSQFGNGFRDGQPYYGTPTDIPADSAPTAEGDGDRRKDNLNLASLILGIISLAGHLCCFTCLTPVTSVLSIIFACMGRENGHFGSKGLVGFILSIVNLVLLVLIAFVYILIILMGTSGTFV